MRAILAQETSAVADPQLGQRKNFITVNLMLANIWLTLDYLYFHSMLAFIDLRDARLLYRDAAQKMTWHAQVQYVLRKPYIQLTNIELISRTT